MEPNITSPTLINNIILLGIGLITAYTAWKGKVIHKNQEESQEKNLKKLIEVSYKQDKIYEMVNHPMSVALSALATSLEQIARMTKSEEDIIAAVSARQNSKDHNKKQNDADNLRIDNDMKRHKIIEDFLNEGRIKA